MCSQGLGTARLPGRLFEHHKPTGIRPTFMWKFGDAGIELPPGEFGIPPEDPKRPD